MPLWHGFFFNLKSDIMKIRFGALAVGAIGKAGGQCIQRFRHEYILRNITVPTQTLQTRSNKQRQTMAYLATRWGSVSPSGVLSWAYAATLLSTFNKWGDPVVLSPRQAFTKLNMPQARWEPFSYQETFLGRSLAEVEFNYNSIDTNQQRINFDYGYRSDDVFQEFFALRINSLNVNPPPYKMKSVLLMKNSSPSPTGLYSLIGDAVGQIRDNNIYALGYRYASNDGIWSPMKIQKFIAQNI